MTASRPKLNPPFAAINSCVFVPLPEIREESKLKSDVPPFVCQRSGEGERADGIGESALAMVPTVWP